MIEAIENILYVWKELAECYYGMNGYGSVDAEIYEYRLSMRDPDNELRNAKGEMAVPDARAAALLTEICVLFSELHDCTVVLANRFGNKEPVIAERGELRARIEANGYRYAIGVRHDYDTCRKCAREGL